MNIPKFVPADESPEEKAKRLGLPPPTESPAPAPAVAPDSNPSAPTARPPEAAEQANTVQPTSAAATTGPAPGDPSVVIGTDDAAGVVWVAPEEQTIDERAEVARLSANVDLAFPKIGFIDPEVELKKLIDITRNMDPALKLAYPEKVRAAVLAHEAGKGPEVPDEDLALAIFIMRTTATPLTEEELEAKASGKKKRDPSAPKTPRGRKTKGDSADQLKDLLGL